MGTAPSRGITSELKAEPLLITAKWPSSTKDLFDKAVDSSFSTMQDLVRAIRDLRMKSNVPLGKKVDVRIKSEQRYLDIISPLQPMISNLAGLQSLKLGEDIQASSESAVAVSGSFEIFLDGAIDKEKEQLRLTEQQLKLNEQVAKLRVRLDNQDFIARAKPEIIAKHKNELQNAELELESVKRTLERLK